MTRYFVLVFLFSLPFWALGALAGAEILPALPVSALMVVVPGGVALWLSHRAGGRAGMLALLRRCVDRVRPRGWLLPITLYMPLALLVSYGLMRAAGLSLPPAEFQIGTLLALFLLFLLAGWAEELGWAGYATDPLVARYGLLAAGLLLGVIWTLWHLPPFFQTGRSGLWILGHCGVTILLRVVMVWFYLRSGRSVFGAALFHAMSNVAFFQFPVMGSHYDPWFLLPVLGVSLVLMLVVPGLRYRAEVERAR